LNGSNRSPAILSPRAFALSFFGAAISFRLEGSGFGFRFVSFPRPFLTLRSLFPVLTDISHIYELVSSYYFSSKPSSSRDFFFLVCASPSLTFLFFYFIGVMRRSSSCAGDQRSIFFFFFPLNYCHGAFLAPSSSFRVLYRFSLLRPSLVVRAFSPIGPPSFSLWKWKSTES